MGVYFFPTPYRDELIYSVIARYHVYSGNPGHIHTLEDLFNTRGVTSSIEFQGNLDSLIRNLPLYSNISSESIINEHTLFPFYAAFVPKDRAQKAIEIMKNGNLSKVYIMLGMLTMGRKNQSLQFLRHCPECLKEDISLYGESYWHRVHQIPGTSICLKHNSYLLDTQYPIIDANRQEYKGARNIQIQNKGLKLSNKHIQKLKLVTEDITRLLDRKYSFYDFEKSRQILINRLINVGLAFPSGMIKQTDLQNKVIEFWGREFLDMSGRGIDKENNANWLTNLVRGSKQISDPIANILLLRSIDIEIDKFLEPNEEIEDHRITMISKLIELASDGESLRSISKKTHISKSTILRELSRMNVDIEIKYNGGGRHIGMDYTETAEYKEKLKQNRERWLILREEFPLKGRYELKEKDQVLFRWLLKYDKDWLFENSELIPDKSSKLDDLWRSRDQQYMHRVEEVVEEMKRGNQRVTISAVASRLGIKGWLPHGLKNLTMISGFLKDEVETTEEYHIRKIAWAIDEIERGGINLNKSNIIKISGVNNKYIMRMENKVRKIVADKGYDCDLYI